MRLFSRRAPEAPRSPPTIEAIFRDDLGFIVGSLGRFGIPAIDVDDAAHEVIRAAERTLPRFDPSRDLRSWLYGVAFHVASNRLRRARRHRARFVDEAADVADELPTIEDDLIQSEIHRTVREVVDAIDLDRRAVLIARVVHGMTELETAEALAIPIGTVKTRLRQAKQELRDGIERRERDDTRTHRGAALLPFAVLLADESRIPAIPGAMRARLWEQLQGLLAQPRPPVRASDGDPAPPRGVRALLRRLLDPEVGRVLAGALVGGALVFALGPFDAPAAPIAARETQTTIGTASTPAVTLTTPIASAVLTTTLSPAKQASTSSPAEIAIAPSDPADPPASADVIKSATVALERHDTAAARRLLDQHARDFPRSKLGTTRELLWVRILLLEGRRGEAQARLEALRKTTPDGPRAQTVDALVAKGAAP
jgi:RNA polymerase sigma-70 factor (ECF subfamily)